MMLGQMVSLAATMHEGQQVMRTLPVLLTYLG